MRFATFDDLRDQVNALLESLLPLAGQTEPVRNTTDPDEFMAHMEDAQAGTVVLVGLPETGIDGLEGRDTPLRAFAAAYPDRPKAETSGLQQCLLVTSNGRVVAAGLVKSSHRPSLDPKCSAHRVDPLGWDEPSEWFDESRIGICWFVMILDRFIDPAPRTMTRGFVRNLAVRSRSLAVHDLTSLLRVAERLLRAQPTDTPLNISDAADRIDRWDTEASAAMALSRTASRDREDPGDRSPGFVGFDLLLSDFSMEPDIRDRLLDLMPATGQRYRAMPSGDRFGWIWSILGSEGVRAALDHVESYEMIRRAIGLRIISDLRHLVYIDIPALRSLGDVLDSTSGGSQGVEPVALLLRKILATAPASFTGLLSALTGDVATAQTSRELIGSGRSSVLLAAARQGLCAPGLLPAAIEVTGHVNGLECLSAAIRALGSLVYANNPYDPRQVASALMEQTRARLPGNIAEALAATDALEVSVAVLHHLYRPISLTFSQVVDLVTNVTDFTHHIAAGGLRPGGWHWSEVDSCYVFGAPDSAVGSLRVYLTKNAPSLLAKGTVGICTAQDIDLFGRTDHHHLNIVDDPGGLVVGNVQLHTLVNSGQRILLVRAVNTTSTYLNGETARAVVEATLVACVELATLSDIDEVHLADGLSFWHLNSSRPQLRAVLESLYNRLPRVDLDKPLFLFQFGRVGVNISKTYRVWARAGSTARDVRLRDILDVVI
jgi:hypothetical protein